MKNQAFIKGYNDTQSVDIDSFGVTLVRGWREALLTPPPVKSYISNSNRKQDGINALTAPEFCKKDKRDVELPFYIEGSNEEEYLSNLSDFFEKIAYSGEISLKVPQLRTVYKLVYTSCSKFGDYGLKRGTFTLKMTENNPGNRENI